jgi:hypothetical protein
MLDRGETEELDNGCCCEIARANGRPLSDDDADELEELGKPS